MVTMDEFRAEIRAEVSRREVELEGQRARMYSEGRARRSDARLTPEAAAQVKFIEAELEKLTGIPAWLSQGQRRALELAGEDERGVVEVARVRSRDRGLRYQPVGEGASTMSVYSLGERGLLQLSYDDRGRIGSGRLTERGAQVVACMRARAARVRERREQRLGRSGA